MDQLNSLDDLLLNKGLEPLDETSVAELRHVQTLDVTRYTEADVREEIINPILRILGYRKGNFSSVDREKHISFADKTSKYIDYNLTLWESNFWLIEAKRPNPKYETFGYKDLSQAVEYAVHPEINAALVVLCDGCKIEVFDREIDLVKPVVHISISEVAREFDKLRNVLSPINVWFFYKRRIIRAIDRAFEHEINQTRVVEVQQIIEKRLNEKRSLILKNYQSMKILKKADYAQHLATASIDEITDIHFFVAQSHDNIDIMTERLISSCANRWSFPVVHKVFPDDPRDVNDYFYMYALNLLIHLEKANVKVDWLPLWLTDNGDSSIHTSIKRLVHLCLTYFDQDEPRKTILLASNTYRRIFKLLAIFPQQRKAAELQHILTRYWAEELSWQQIISSPEHHSVSQWEQRTMIHTTRFAKKHLNQSHTFDIHRAKQQLKELWDLEWTMLGAMGDYRELSKEYNFGETHPTSSSSIIWDNLGHNILCIIKKFPEWFDYVLAAHRDELEVLVEMRSWAAYKVLGLDQEPSLPASTSDELLASRFFFGDIETVKRLKRAYKF